MKRKLKDIAIIQTGYSFRTRLESTHQGGIHVIQMKDLSSKNLVECGDLMGVNLETVKPESLIKKGDLVFRSRGHSTTAAILTEELETAIVAAPLIKIRVLDTKAISPEYLNWFINQKEAQSFFTRRAKGSAQKMITKNTLGELEIPLPPLKRQKLIVEISELLQKEKTILKKLSDKREQQTSMILRKCAEGAK